MIEFENLDDPERIGYCLENKRKWNEFVSRTFIPHETADDETMKKLDTNDDSTLEANQVDDNASESTEAEHLIQATEEVEESQVIEEIHEVKLFGAEVVIH